MAAEATDVIGVRSTVLLGIIMRLTIENTTNHSRHFDRLLGSFRFRLKVRTFKSGGVFAGYYEDGYYCGLFPGECVGQLLKNGRIEECGREEIEGDPFVTYRPTLKGIHWNRRRRK